jgi:DNA polymerase bacteriophage-type
VLQKTTQEQLSAGTATATTTHILFRDYETRGQAVLRAIGSQRYAADCNTEIIVACYAIDDGPVEVWRPGDAIPNAFILAAQSAGWIAVAHGVAFELAVEKSILAPRYNWPQIPISRNHDTMSMALSCGLPAKLSAVADALELSHRKDGGGEKLMHQMSKPRRPRKDEDPQGIFWFEDPERIERLISYCAEDVRVTREIFNRLPQLSPAEQAIWQLSHQINVRGFHIDRAFAEAARKIAEAAAPEIDAEIAEITGGDITTINQVAKLTAWLQDHGCSLKTLDRKAIQRQLEKGDDELTAPVRRVLELRLGGAQAATKKISALLARAGADDRARGAFRYHGAATGRWSGEGIQPQNLKRPIVDDLDAAIAAVATGDYQHVRALYPRPLAVVGDCSRAMICAAPGCTLIGADFSSIESRVLAWVAGESSKLDTFRRFDATHDPRDEPYCITACKIFNKPNGTYTKDDPERGVGKTCDLALGYAGGVNAFRKFSDQFTDDEVKAFVRSWRQAHPEIKRLWDRLDRAAWTAVQERGRVVRCGVVRFQCDGAFLQLILPSGRKISYPQPRIIGDKHEQHVVFADNAAGQFVDCRHGQGAYGGLWTENVVSGVARDLLADAMLRIEAAGYPIILHIHDEVVAEVPEGIGSTDEFTHLMTRKPAWGLDLPIAAKAWTGKRYCK